MFIRVLEPADKEQQLVSEEEGPGPVEVVSDLERRQLAILRHRVQNRSFHFIPILLEEIALEGLDGITLQGLWLRLQHRPGFNLSINQYTKAMFWDSLRFTTNIIAFFELPVERSDLHFYNRTDNIDERGNYFEPLSAPQDVYVYAPVEDTELGVRGSCFHYKQRTRVDEDVKRLTFDQVSTAFGNSLVLVASQEMRNQALFGDTYIDLQDLVIVQFCMMERIGRARYHGESTNGNVSLNVMKINPKALFYQRKTLLSSRLITKQPFAMKFGPNRINSFVSILHLPRFFVKYTTSAEKHFKDIFQELKAAANLRKEASLLRSAHGKHIVSTFLTPEYDGVFECVNILAAELSVKEKEGETDETEPNTNVAEKVSKRTVQVIQLKQPNLNVEAYLAKKASLEEEDEAGDNDKGIVTFSDGVRVQTSTLFNIWKYLQEQSVDGCSFVELVDQMKIFLLDARSAMRLTTKLKLATVVFEERKGHKWQRYIYFKCSEAYRLVREAAANARVRQIDAPCDPLPPVQSPRPPAPPEPLIELVELKFSPEKTPTVRLRKEQRRFNAKVRKLADPSTLVPLRKRRKVEDDQVSEANEVNEANEVSDVDVNEVVVVSGAAAIRRVRRGTSKAVKTAQPHMPKRTRALYDETDLAVLRAMKAQRVGWNPEEDTLILHLFISSILFIPSYNKLRLIMFNAAQIRDVMHTKLNASRSKTALSIRRRLHVLLKRRSVFSLLHQRLDVALSDKQLKSYIRDNYPLNTAAMTMRAQSAAVSTKALVEVFDYLHERFQTGTVQPPNLIHSHSATKKRKTKVQDSGQTLVNNVPPIGRQVETVGVCMVVQEHASTNKIIDCRSPPTTNDELRVCVTKTILISLLFTSHSSEVVRGIVDQMDHSVLDGVLQYLRGGSVLTEAKLGHRFTLSLQFRRRLANFLTPQMYKRCGRIWEAVQAKGAFNCNGTTSTSALFALSELTALQYHNSNKWQIDVELPLNAVDFTPKWKQILADNREAPDIAANSKDGDEFSLRHYKTLMQHKLGRNYNKPQDTNVFSLSLPSITVTLPTHPTELLPTVDEGYLQRTFLQIIPSLEEREKVDIPGDFLHIARAVFASRQTGLPTKTLVHAVDSSNSSKSKPKLVYKAMEFLLNSKLVYIVGTDTTRLVAFPFVAAWSMPLTDNRTALTRPWVSVTGHVNYELVDQVLASLLGYIGRHPGLCLRQLGHFLVPVLTPVDTSILIHVLHHFKLVNLFQLQPSHKVTLFSQPVHHTLSKLETDVLDLDSVCVELVPFHLLKYTALQQRFHATCSNDNPASI